MEKPHAPSREEIWKMFDVIAPTYDRVNRVMTFGLDRYWRWQVVKHLLKGELCLLDCATGTGDQLFSVMKRRRDISRAIGIDLSSEMVEIAKRKAADRPYAKDAVFQVASALALPFANDAFFDAITFSFGIRNVTDVVST